MKVGVIWEKFGPVIVSTIAFGLAARYGDAFFVASDKNKWHLDALYASVFNISSASSAFLFAFYIYTSTSEGNILKEIRESPIFKRASCYMINAILSAAFLAIISVPLLIVVPLPMDIHSTWYWTICVWAAYVAYVFAMIFRSAYHFIAIMEAAYGDRLGS